MKDNNKRRINVVVINSLKLRSCIHNLPLPQKKYIYIFKYINLLNFLISIYFFYTFFALTNCFSVASQNEDE